MITKLLGGYGLTAIILSNALIVAGLTSSVYVLGETKASLYLHSKYPEEFFIDSKNSNTATSPKIFTIQGAIPPAADTTQPRVVSFSPTNGATGVPLSIAITAIFSEPVQPSTVSSSTFQVRDSANNIVPGTITMEPPGVPPNVIKFKPASPLAVSKVYSATITTGVKDLAGNPLVGITKWSFTTAATTPTGTTTAPVDDTTPPKVVSVTPRNGALGVQFTSPITATFSEPINPSTVNPGNFYAQALPSLNRMYGMVTLSPDGKTAKLQLGGQLPAPWYIIILTPEVRDLKGNRMISPVVWAYSTVAAPPAGTSTPPAGTSTPPAGTSTPPAGTTADTIQPRVVNFNPPNGATGVSLMPTITVTFSERVQPSTVNTATFQVRDSAGNIVPGAVTMDPAAAAVNMGMFRPSIQLASSKVYSATITTGVKDLAGNPLVGITKWSFTTGTQAPAGTSQPPTGTSGTSSDTTALKVVSARPANGATGVAVSSSIIVTFSKPVQPSTVTTTFDLVTTGPGGGVGPLQLPSIVHVTGTATLSADGKTVTFRPAQPLTATKTYTYSILGPKDLAGNPLTPFPNLGGSFTTGPS